MKIYKIAQSSEYEDRYFGSIDPQLPVQDIDALYQDVARGSRNILHTRLKQVID